MTKPPEISDHRRQQECYQHGEHFATAQRCEKARELLAEGWPITAVAGLTGLTREVVVVIKAARKKP